MDSIVPAPLSPQDVSRKLDSVQALRGMAALWVVIYHAAAIWREHAGLGADAFSGPWDQGYAGVDLFFVISGFIMVWVAGYRPAGLGTIARFAFERVTRIYPLWWVFCAIMAAYFFVTYAQPAAPNVADSDSAWGYFAASMALWPQAQMPVLQVGWTLVFEMAFYAVFAALLLLPERIRPFVLTGWAVALIARLILGDPAPNMPGAWWGVLSHPLVLEFLMGAGVAYAILRWRDEGWAKFLGLAGALGLVVWLVLGLDVSDPNFPAARVLVYGVPAALLLAGWVKAEEGGLSVPRGLITLGDSSYALYLSHFITLLIFKRILAVPGFLEAPNALSMALFVLFGTIISVVGGIIAHRLVERPLLRAARAIWPKSKAAAEAG